MALFLAHIAGFASINLWSGLQQIRFGGEPSLAFSYLATPIGLVCQFGLQRITNAVRYRITMADDEESIFEREWNKQTAAAEDDIMALTISFTLVQSIRFTISGELPDKEGAYEASVLREKFDGGLGAVYMMGVGISLMLVAFFCATMFPEKEETIDDLFSDVSSSVAGRRGCWQSMKDSVKEMLDDIKERGTETMVLTAGMGFAWSVFFSTRWFVANFTFLDISSENSPDMEMVAIITALILSFASFIAIFVLDWIHDKVGEESPVGQALIKSIETIGVLVGFAWEQCFDGSVEAISSTSTSPHLVKFVLAFFSVCLVAPAWKIYLLPMAYQGGWKFGFVPSEEKMHAANSFYVEKHSDSHKFDVRKTKKRHSGELHRRKSKDLEEEDENNFSLMLEEDGAAVLEENIGLKNQIKLLDRRCDALSAFCREHVVDIPSTISGLLSPISKLEEGRG